jgi:hypothetical protein
MAMLGQDFRLISSTIQLGHPVAPVSLSHLTKEMASLLLDQPPPYLSSLQRRFTIHGVETISANSGILQKASALDGNIAKIAEQMNYYKVTSTRRRKTVHNLMTRIELEGIVSDEYLYSEEARLLGRLKLTDKIILAGHRTRDMTLESYSSVSKLLVNTLQLLKLQFIRNETNVIPGVVDKACECAHEMVLKVEYYPQLVPTVRLKLEAYPSIAAALIASTIDQYQGSFDEQLCVAKVIERGIHLLRSILASSGTYKSKSLSWEIEDHLFKQLCKVHNIGTPTSNLFNNPIILIDFLLDLLLYKWYWEVEAAEQNT